MGFASHVIAKSFSKVKEVLQITSQPSRPKDIALSRIFFDENAVILFHDPIKRYLKTFKDIRVKQICKACAADYPSL